MRSNARWGERIGAVFLPEADEMEVQDGREPAAGELQQGCYTVQHTPTGAGEFDARFQGTIRVELTPTGPRISGDFYRYRLADPSAPTGDREAVPDEAADVTSIPAYPRRTYNSYLRGSKADAAPGRLTLEFEQFTYSHPRAGFSGSFPDAPSRRVRFTLEDTPTAGLWRGRMHVLQPSGGTRLLGAVSMRLISPFFRRARVQVHALVGAVPPPAVDGTAMGSIFADAGWDVAVADGGSIRLPPALADVKPKACWSEEDLHTLMQSVPGYDPAGLDAEWLVHLVVVPAKMGCNRGIMFDWASGSVDPNAVPREGAATFSHDGYPPGDFEGTNRYDSATGKQQRNVPRAYLRSATHEVGHAFNQIHQGDEGGIDNSIMSSTASVASVLGAGTFPDGINLAFNATVKRHLRHYPDPAVRPGGMEYFGSTIAAPEPADVDWANTLRLDVAPSAERVRLGQPLTLDWTLANHGEAAVAVPHRIDAETLVARISVTDPTGRITFMRPPVLDACFASRMVAVEPGATASGSTTLFWGRDGFAFETPGRHRVEVILLWKVDGAPVAVSGEADVFVEYPVSDDDNDVAALMLHPEVGRVVCAGGMARFDAGARRIRAVLDRAGAHPAKTFLRERGMG